MESFRQNKHKMSAKPKSFRRGEYIFKEGTPSDSLLIIQKGTVSIRKRKGTGQIEIARVYANEVIGELSFFDRLPRSASAYTLSQVEALEIDFVDLEKIYKGIPHYFQTIMACVAERLRKSSTRIQKLQRTLVEEDIDFDDDDDEDNTASVLAGLDENTPGEPVEDGDDPLDAHWKKSDEGEESEED